MAQTKDFYAIGRSINGISLNGQEFVCNPDDTVMKFSSIRRATYYAARIATGTATPEIDLEAYGINICKFDADGKYELC